MAAALVSTALHVTGRSHWLMLAAGGLLVVLAAASDGPLGAGRLLGRHAHRAADWVVLALLAASPLAPGRDAVSIIVLEACAALLWRLIGMTSYDRRPVAPAPSLTAGPPAASASSVATPSPPTGAAPASKRAGAAPPGPAAEEAVRRQARKAGLAVGILARRARSARRQS